MEMLLSVYLEPEVHDVLCVYGELEEVVNRILDAGTEGAFDISNKPNYYKDRSNCNRYEVLIKNEEYISLKNRFPINSSKISLRRLLQWFVYEEVYNDLGWTPVKQYQEKFIKKYGKLKGGIQSSLLKLKKISTKSQIEKIDKIIVQLNEV